MQYQGSKKKYSKQILNKIKKYLIIEYGLNDNIIKKLKFYDLFFGGGNISENVNEILGIKNIIGNDNNKFLIELYNKGIESYKNGNYSDLYELYFEIKNGKYSKELYNYSKKNKTKFEFWKIGFLGYFCTFNSLFYNGGFIGKINNGKILLQKLNSFIKLIYKINNIKILNEDYNKINIKGKNNIIYVDPPYENTLNYNENEEFNYDDFYKHLFNLYEKGNYIFISEYNINEKYIKKYNIIKILEFNVNNNKYVKKRKELLYTFKKL